MAASTAPEFVRYWVDAQFAEQNPLTMIIAMTVTLFIGIILVLSIAELLRVLLSTICVRNKIYEIQHISSETEPGGFGAFGRWETRAVTLKDTKSGKTKVLDVYPNFVANLHAGDRVGLVKRPAEHTYEIDKYYLIPESEFNVKAERKKYVYGTSMNIEKYN
ncbi:hypothetical protein JUJ52_03050 [Virgibacillus sp. AGTR]|uniref:hypothetical protein n=1 Tax=Virgibacillus sp. AGTR TaxID=2812055 RepID=UPI001D162D62|nr:hypothetical protein [Virgibacillus sp. AGTR]MCC2248935.1 hypothetical protein [Virgibacillus sp. AGTR]